MKFISGDSYILSKAEYDALTSPDKTYSLMTKTAARKAVDNLLSWHRFKCFNDIRPKMDPDDCNCMSCPLYRVLGEDVAERMCTRRKYFSQ